MKIKTKIKAGTKYCVAECPGGGGGPGPVQDNS
jgi:hypothetical protein